MTSKKKEPDKTTGPEGAELGSWRGYTQYRCTACPFDTLNREAFDDHWRAAHGALETHEAEPPVYDTPPAPVGETFVQE